MAEEKKSRSERMYGKSRRIGDADEGKGSGAQREERPAHAEAERTAGKPEKAASEAKGDKPEEKPAAAGGGEDDMAGGSVHAIPMSEMHGREMKDMHTRHEKERRDMHTRHEHEHAAVRGRHEKEMSAGLSDMGEDGTEP